MTRILSIVLGGIFIWAGVVKLLDPAGFASAIASMRILPRELINATAMCLPPFEVLCGGAVITGVWRRAAALAVALMSGLFALAIAQAWLRGLHFECGCFGRFDPLAHQPGWAIARDVVFLSMAVCVWRSCAANDQCVRSAGG